MRSKASLGSSREIAQGRGVSFTNYLYLVLLIIGQNFCATHATNNQTGPLRLSPTIPPIQLPLNVLFTIFYYLSPKDSSPYNSFSPIIPLISIPPIYYHSLTNYLFNVFEFKKNIQYLYCHNTHYYRVTGLKRD